MSEETVSELMPTLSDSQSQQIQPFRNPSPAPRALQNAEMEVFVLVRCTYKDNVKWSEFLETLKLQYNPIQPLAQSQPWTTIEDKEKLDSATMSQATLVFDKWVKIAGVEEMHNPRGMRYQYYIYVNEESIESVINPVRAAEKTGNFLILVSLRDSLIGEEDDDSRPEEYFDDQADFCDRSWKLIDAKNIKGIFNNNWNWYHFYDDASGGMGPPIVYYRHSHFRAGEEGELLRYPDPVGMDVYKMMKQIYGKEHPRSRCFEAPEAQSKLQKLRGYAGGIWGCELNDFLNTWISPHRTNYGDRRESVQKQMEIWANNQVELLSFWRI